MNEVFAKRFNELDARFAAIRFSGGNYSYAKGEDWKGLAASAEALLEASCGKQSPHYLHYLKACQACTGGEGGVKSLIAVFQSAKDAFENGYLFDMQLALSGEVFGDFVALAKKALEDGYKDVAAVLACAALEDALKRFALIHNLDVENKTMQEVINALKGQGLVGGAMRGLLDAMPRIRNLALHAEWEKLSAPEVSSVIGFVEQFLLTKFTPP